MRIAEWSFGSKDARLLVWPAVVIAGCIAWILLPGPSGAESTFAERSSGAFYQSASLLSDTPMSEQTAVVSPVQGAAPTAVSAPAPETATVEKPAIDGLKISSQSWRRGGLGSKALVTFTLRNANDYPVRDIEIACAFTRRDGSHLTDRSRVIGDTVSMKSRKKYAGMLIGFVNVNANKAKCSPVAASRI